MGVSLANAAHARGAKVTLAAGAIQAEVERGISVIPARSTQDMYQAVTANAHDADVVICAAAPADFTPEHKSDIKIKKQGAGEMTLKLIPTPDILKEISKDKGNRIHIGFAAETNDIKENALKKLNSKNLNAIAANDVSRSDSGFGLGKNAITLYCANGKTYESGSMNKTELAHWLLDRIKDIWQ